MARSALSKLRHLVLLPLLVGFLSCAGRTVTVVHFSDYHSHAVPFYVDGERDSAGVARALAYLAPLARRADTLVLSGGDTMNAGAPAWSDKYHCVEWPWWNGVVAAMAYGNHDADYGAEELRRCEATIDYPLLAGNLRDGAGNRRFAPYAVFTRAGRRIGVFALAGSDFATLVKPERAAVAGAVYTPRAEAAREIVSALRGREHVEAVVLIGHAHNQEDEQLAREVAGIDVIFGTHSHLAAPLHRVAGTATWMIASGQYLERVSQLRLRFAGHRLRGVDGGLVPMRHALPEDPVVAARVATLRAELESDPAYAPLFVTIARLDRELGIAGCDQRDTPLGRYVLDAVRAAAGADVALSTASSFRAALPPGPLREADLLDALPYDNPVLRYQLTGAQLAAVLERGLALRGGDMFPQLSGVSLGASGRESRVGGAPLDPAAVYSVATTSFVARVSRYQDLFAGLPATETGLTVRGVVRAALVGSAVVPTP